MAGGGNMNTHTFIILGLLTACGPDARERDAMAYVEQMQPLLAENLTLSREFLDMAAKIKQRELTHDQLAERMGERIVPRAKALKESVKAVAPETQALSDVHKGLVRAWSNRADAYGRMHTAWQSDDLQVFNAAAGDHTTVQKAEQRYFVAVESVLAPYKLKLDSYPD